MRDRPTADRLLEEARRTLLRDILPALDETHRYSLLMIANAMAIAARELRGGEAVARAERAALSAFLDEAEGEASQLEAKLAAAIRSGTRDGDPALHRLLSESARRRLEITNPKVLHQPARR